MYRMHACEDTFLSIAAENYRWFVTMPFGQKGAQEPQLSRLTIVSTCNHRSAMHYFSAGVHFTQVLCEAGANSKLELIG